MNKSIPTTPARTSILLLLAIIYHSAFSQTQSHNKELSDVRQVQTQSEFGQRFNDKTGNSILQMTEKTPGAFATMYEPYVLYGNDPSRTEDFYVAFNLEKDQIVKYELFNIEGKSILRDEWPEVSNQTFRIESKTTHSGLYIFRMLIGNKYYINRIYISQ